VGDRAMVKHIQVEGLRRLSCAPPLKASPHHRLHDSNAAFDIQSTYDATLS
jgi:hypothetical protein